MAKCKTLDPKELVKAVQQNKVKKYIPALKANIEIHKLSWPQMMKLKTEDMGEEEKEIKLFSFALGISEEDARKMRDGDGMLYGAVLGAINEVYSVQESEVKK